MSDLNALIEQFLANKRQSENMGYSIPTDDDLAILTRIIERLIEMKFESDPDGHWPITVRLINNTVGHFPFFKAIPHDSKDAWKVTLHNLKVATERIDYYLGGAGGDMEDE